MAEGDSVVASPTRAASASMSTTSSIMMPSTTHSGFELPKIDVAPRTRILGAVPNVPETFWTETPAERPSRPRLMVGHAGKFHVIGDELVRMPR